MRPESLTIKAREALQEAHSLTSRLGHPEVRALHLLVALCEQPEGIVAPVLQRLGADPGTNSTSRRLPNRSPTSSGFEHEVWIVNDCSTTPSCRMSSLVDAFR